MTGREAGKARSRSCGGSAPRRLAFHEGENVRGRSSETQGKKVYLVGYVEEEAERVHSGLEEIPIDGCLDPSLRGASGCGPFPLCGQVIGRRGVRDLLTGDPNVVYTMTGHKAELLDLPPPGAFAAGP